MTDSDKNTPGSIHKYNRDEYYTENFEDGLAMELQNLNIKPGYKK